MGQKLSVAINVDEFVKDAVVGLYEFCRFTCFSGSHSLIRYDRIRNLDRSSTFRFFAESFLSSMYKLTSGWKENK